MTTLKSLDTLAIGDWVLLESLITSRHVSTPWKVVRLAGARVYLERAGQAPRTDASELTEEKFVQRKSVLYAFKDEASANAVYLFARKNSEEYEAKARALEKEYTARFKAFAKNPQAQSN